MAKLKKVEILIEAIVLDKVIEEMIKLGVKAYVVYDVVGKGSRGIESRSMVGDVHGMVGAVFGQKK